MYAHCLCRFGSIICRSSFALAIRSATLLEPNKRTPPTEKVSHRRRSRPSSDPTDSDSLTAHHGTPFLSTDELWEALCNDATTNPTTEPIHHHDDAEDPNHATTTTTLRPACSVSELCALVEEHYPSERRFEAMGWIHGILVDTDARTARRSSTVWTMLRGLVRDHGRETLRERMMTATDDHDGDSGGGEGGGDALLYQVRLWRLVFLFQKAAPDPPAAGVLALPRFRDEVVLQILDVIYAQLHPAAWGGGENDPRLPPPSFWNHVESLVRAIGESESQPPSSSSFVVEMVSSLLLTRFPAQRWRESSAGTYFVSSVDPKSYRAFVENENENNDNSASLLGTYVCKSF